MIDEVREQRLHEPLDVHCQVALDRAQHLVGEGEGKGE